jgi:Ca2+-binding EF-hand superfamily protein
MKITLFALSLLLSAAVRAADAPAAAPEIHVKETPKEKARVHAHFHVIDTNGDGVIDAKELAAYAKMVHARMVKQAAKAKAAQVPSYDEVLAGLKAELAKADAAHDGKITETEYDQYEEPLEK